MTAIYVGSIVVGPTYEESWEWVELTEDEWFIMDDSRIEMSERIGVDE